MPDEVRTSPDYSSHLPATAGVFAMNRTYHQPACSCGWYEEGHCYTTMKEAMSVARRHAADNARPVGSDG